MSNYEATKYDFTGANLTGIEGIPTATIVPWSSASVPTGFLECNGQAVSRSTYSALFAIVASTYGGGDGSSTFNVPNLQDNVAVGKSNNKALASTGGANTVAVTPTGNISGSTANASLSESQLASHQHNLGGNNPGNQNNFQQAGVQFGVKANGGSTLASGNTGSGNGHQHNMSANFSGSASNPSVLQPYLTIIYIIKT
jgi:microcystin-dependent protein|eukprot:COSAG05_NODE_6845_length_893_cov_0.837531_1_plen_199_part_00